MSAAAHARETWPDFLSANARWLAAGFLMALGSSFGQTFFIAIFSEPLRAAYALSHGDFGAIYMVATLASAACIIQLGRLADSWPAQRLAVAVALALAGVMALMALANHWILLLLAIFGLRLFGQGMISHLSQTTMARWFNATRGRALAVAAFGYPTGEALAPLAAVALILAIGWRETWGVAALFAALVLAPTLWLLLSKDRDPRGRAAVKDAATGRGGRHWTRGEAVRGSLFWLLLPGLLAPGFMLTVLFFLPSHIAETKGWAAETMPNRYWVYAATSLGASLIAGVALDRFGALRCLPLYQLPMAAGLLILAFGETPAAASAALGLAGLSAGAAATLHSALWAELYGARHIGAIKALGHAAMVFATAAGPGLAGALIDAGAPFTAQAQWMAAYALGVSLLFTWLALRSPTAASSRR